MDFRSGSTILDFRGQVTIFSEETIVSIFRIEEEDWKLKMEVAGSFETLVTMKLHGTTSRIL
jgi:hypothetical protein